MENIIHMREIHKALGRHYTNPNGKYVKTQMWGAAKRLAAGEEYRFTRGLPGARWHKEVRLFKRNGKFDMFIGWSRSSDKCFH